MTVDPWGPATVPLRDLESLCRDVDLYGSHVHITKFKSLQFTVNYFSEADVLTGVLTGPVTVLRGSGRVFHPF